MSLVVRIRVRILKVPGTIPASDSMLIYLHGDCSTLRSTNFAMSFAN